MGANWTVNETASMTAINAFCGANTPSYPTAWAVTIVSLWLVDSNRAEIFTDSSQDSFAGDPFDWNRFDCRVDLPLPGSVTPTADPYATFDC